MNDKKLDELNKGIKVLIFFVIVLIVLLSCFFAFYIISNDKETTDVDNQEITTNINSKLRELGSQFYKTYYYNAIGSTDEERANNVKKYVNIGVKVDLENLIRFNSNDQDGLRQYFSNYDEKNTKVIIYPKAPYGVKDFIIKIELEKK